MNQRVSTLMLCGADRDGARRCFEKPPCRTIDSAKVRPNRIEIETMFSKSQYGRESGFSGMPPEQERARGHHLVFLSFLCCDELSDFFSRARFFLRADIKSITGASR